MTCHVICKQWVSLLPFPVLTPFLFLVWLLWLGLKILCWIKIVLMSISVFFLILKEMLELFTTDVGFYDVRCGFVHAWPLLCWGLFSLLRWEFFLIINGCCIFSKNFSMSIKKIVWIFFSFLLLHLQHMEVLSPEVKSELQLWPTPQSWQHWIWATSVIYTTASNNVRSLTHWVRPGIKPTSSETTLGP